MLSLMQNAQFAAMPTLSDDFPQEKLSFYLPPHKSAKKHEIDSGLTLSETEAMVLLGCSKETLRHLKDYAGLVCVRDEGNRIHFRRSDIFDFMSFTTALLEGRL